MGKPREKMKVKAKTKDTEKSNSDAKLAQARSKYLDGHPLDEVQYLEAKLILKPEPFTSVDSFREFGWLVSETAEKVKKVAFDFDPKATQDTNVREIVFFDTPDFRLYNNAFILRRRVAYVHGFPAGDPEIVIKFRHPDEQKAAALDMRPKAPGKYRIKFKVEALPLKEKLGGVRLLFSHNCVLGLDQVHLENRSAPMGPLTRTFPVLGVLKKSDREEVSLVNEAIVEEVLLDLGVLDFGKGVTAKANVALWRTRGEHRPLVGEFAFQCKFVRREDVQEKPKKRCREFYLQLQEDAKKWIALGATKTGMVYRLSGNPPQSHE
jgi:hypothetical protein